MPEMTKPEREFYALWWQLQRAGHAGLDWPDPVREHPFHPARAWRLDFAFPDAMVAVEVEGAVFVGGRHSRGAGLAEDANKYNEAVFLGWAVVRLTDKQLKPQPVRYTKAGKQKAGSGSNPVDLLEKIAKLIATRLANRSAKGIEFHAAGTGDKPARSVSQTGSPPFFLK